VLVDYAAQGRVQRRLLWANRNGFYYVIDRSDGKLIASRPFVQQNWAEGLDPGGRPIPNKALEAAQGGFVIYPGGTGGTNWWSPSYDPALGTFSCRFSSRGAVFVADARNPPADTALPFYTGVRALMRDPSAALGARHEPRLTDSSTGGLLSTRSGLVFGSDLRTFFALDCLEQKSGSSRFETGAKIAAAPITYRTDGQQHVAVISGRDLLVFALPPESTIASR
jgi:alcohol dehydrogenase (cytochrome c)